MALESMIVSAGVYCLKRIAKYSWEKIQNYISEKKLKENYELIHGTIETKYPRLSGVAQPWLKDENYFKSFQAQPIEVKVDYSDDLKSAVLCLPIQKVQSIPKVESNAGVVSIKFDYGSEVDLEIGNNFQTSNLGEASINFGTFTSIDQNNIIYNEKELDVPLNFDFPVKQVIPINVKYPHIPTRSKAFELPYARKVDAEIPVITF